MLTALVFAFLVVYLYERTRPLLVQLLAAKPVPAAPVAVKAEPLPTDLLLVAAQESEPWAKEQALQAMREAYDATLNWNAVRQRFGLPPAVE